MLAGMLAHLPWLALAWSAAAAHASDPEPLPGLKRVLVLARHGNRAPNPQIEVVCPTFAREVLPKFGVSPAALSLVGMAENEENGRFLRNRYRDFLPEGPFRYDGTFSFFSERVQRNIVSTTALAQGMFPVGTGMPGFAPERPNIVPIATTQDGADVLMNCPRDGPCQRRYARDKRDWVEKHEERIYSQHRELFRKVSGACGYPLEPGKIVYEGKRKPLIWAAKAVMDAFTFSKNEGLDYTIGGRIDEATVRDFHEVVEGMVQQMNFGQPHQITYWTGDFIPTMLGLARAPLVDPVNKLHVFLNHRELVYAVAHMLGMPIQFPGTAKDSLPSGCSIVAEVYEEGLRLFFWAPSQPTFQQKAKHLAEGLPMKELFSFGTLMPTQAAGCSFGLPCPVEVLASSFINFVSRTGTYVSICDVGLEQTYFARGEASLGIMETWVQPDVLAARGVNITRASAAAAGLTSEDAAALGFSLAEPTPATRIEVQMPAWSSLVAISLSAATGFLGWSLGRRSGRQELEPASPYSAMA